MNASRLAAERTIAFQMHTLETGRGCSNELLPAPFLYMQRLGSGRAEGADD